MEKINPRPGLINRPTSAADVQTSHPSDSTQNERGITCGIGRSGGFMTTAVIAAVGVVIAGLLFGWSGWLTASLGGISLLALLPCLTMCVGMIWMMRGGNAQSSKDPNPGQRS